ncbi:GH116 family glycosyl hydrolase [Acidianus sp. RZ1]|uniref:GH116 family glycosyl hydrolase n=1 Tax=Acidianus sp. RZ1 TaxID=1540082 RepID=UPI001490D227|nr:GH116 family glycosyl hydrolase [Acidianus sp. RZ1]NON63234.1 hypothetical protein [Acidianus sp. RZ1]
MLSIPIGSIGTGKMNFTPDFTITDITVLNNWANPLDIRGFHVVRLDDQPIFLQNNPGERIEEPPKYITKKVKFDALFPRVTYSSPDFSVEVFSPLIPGNLKDSSLPVIFFKIKGEGKFAISFPNIIGRRYGRANFSWKGQINGVEYKNLRSLQSDPAYGEMFLGCENCKVYAFHPYYIPGKKGMTEDISVFNKLIEGEENSGGEIFPYAREEIMGIVYTDIIKEKYFVLSWYTNGRPYNYPYGHYYENFFHSAIDVAKYALNNVKRLDVDWNVEEEGWLKEAIRNSSYILTSNTWLTKDGRLAMYETPFVAPLMNTIGSFTWDGASFALLKLFPDLVLKMDEYFANFIREGEVPHDLGEESIEDPIYGASYISPWTDLASTWILMIYRDYLFTGDTNFLMRLFDKVKEAIDWLISLDRDGDGVPDSKGGFDNSYDGTHMYGTSSYVASMFLCSMNAFFSMANILGKEIDKKYREVYEKASYSMNSLWNGKYFINSRRGNEEENSSCINSQIAGQIWCQLLSLPPIVEEEKIDKALRSIYELNYRSSNFCLTNSTLPDGKIDLSTGQMRSCWPRVSFAVSALMILRGMDSEGMEIAKREWDTIRSLNPWNQSSRIDAIDGKYVGLMSYIGSMNVWLIHIAREIREKRKDGGL